MIYFLKKSYPTKKGLYLQIYTNYYDKETKTKKTKSYKTLGYESDLIKSGIDNPVEYYTNEIKRMNEEISSSNDIEIGEDPVTLNLGYFLIKCLIDKLNVDEDIYLFTHPRKSKFLASDLLRTLIYAQIISPGSKLKAFEKVIPSIYNSDNYSYDQILDFINYIGNDYEKFIELFNYHINETYEVDTERVLFDCTNYYFEIDLEEGFKMKGPSKENRKSPIISQALMLDKNRIPIGMKMFPGNESEKPELRKMIIDTKERYDIDGRIIQVADKGLNCAKNIYAACVEANDGYIFSKSLRGNSIGVKEKALYFEEESKHKWVEVYNKDKTLRYKYKEFIGAFVYKFKDDNGKPIEFKVREKRILTFNPSLEAKQRLEINKMVNKVKETISLKEAFKDEFGDAKKYIIFDSETGEKTNAKAKLNQDKIDEDLSLCGYNLLVSSELNMKANEIYEAYHSLSKIEESFRIMKSYLEARPVFLQNIESIFGHFLICYLSLTVLRLLELKEFNDDICVSEIINYIRDFNVTVTPYDKLINNTRKTEYYKKIKEALGLTKIGNLYLSNKDIKNILEYEF